MNTSPEEQQGEGAWDKLKGKVKDAVGGATDDPGLQAEGKWDKLKGDVKENLGEARANVRDNI